MAKIAKGALTQTAFAVRPAGGFLMRNGHYHCSIKTISRGAGQSVVASAAYRHACKLTNERTGEVYDYTRKTGLEASKIILPSGVNPDLALDREKLWNTVEAAEKRKNARKSE